MSGTPNRPGPRTAGSEDNGPTTDPIRESVRPDATSDPAAETIALPALPTMAPRLIVDLTSVPGDDDPPLSVRAGPPPAPPASSGAHLPPLDPSLRSQPAAHGRRTASSAPSPWTLIAAVAVVVAILVAVVATSASRSNNRESAQPRTAQDQASSDPPDDRRTTLSVGSVTEGQVGVDGTATFLASGSGTDVAVEVQGIGGFDSTVTVIDAFGDEVAFDDDTNGLDPEAVVFMTSGDRYTIEVQGYAGTAGAFSISIVDAAISTAATGF